MDETLGEVLKEASIILSKIFERELNDQINKYIENFLSDFLFGYRAGYGTQFCLVTMIEIFYFLTNTNITNLADDNTPYYVEKEIMTLLVNLRVCQ